MSKIDSRKEIAQEFFRSLDQNMPWKLRLSQTIDYMKGKFPKGQTERVTFQYIKELVSEEDRPNQSAQSIRDAVSAKISELRRSKDNFSDSLQYRNHSLVKKLLMCGDLYSNGFEYDNSNRVYQDREYLVIRNAFLTHNIQIDNAVLIAERIDFSTHPRLQFRDIFPYFDKTFLETPISIKELADLSGDLLSQSELIILEEAFLHGKTFPKAIEWLTGEAPKYLLNEIQLDTQSSIRDKSQPLPEKLIVYSVIFALSLGVFSCINLNEGGSSSSRESKYIERCMENGTPRSVCSDWYEEIERSVNERR